MRNYPIHERATLVQAAMGVGKSEETRRWIQRLCDNYGKENVCIVQLSHRHTFTAQVPPFGLSLSGNSFTAVMLILNVDPFFIGL